VHLWVPRAETESVVVMRMFRIVRSHDFHGPPIGPPCPGLRRFRGTEVRPRAWGSWHLSGWSWVPGV
jgi:hypothetical protein